MQNGYGGIHILTVFPVLYRLFSHFSEQAPVLLDAELGFVDTLGPFRIPERSENFLKAFAFRRICAILLPEDSGVDQLSQR